MTKTEILALFNTDIAAKKKAIVAFIQDLNNSYEDRLEIYRRTPSELQTHYSSLISLDGWDDDDWMNYNNWSRHQVIDITDMPEYHEWDEAKIKDWYEAAMKRGVHTFEFDW